MSLIKQKQIENLENTLAAKANDSQVLKLANNLSDIPDAAQARRNLSLLSDEEIRALFSASAIKTAYESNDDTNAFTDNEKAKLAFITATKRADLDFMFKRLNEIAVAQGNLMNQFTYVEESFTGMTVKEGLDNVLTLSHNIADTHVLTAFFGGVKITNINYTEGE